MVINKFLKSYVYNTAHQVLNSEIHCHITAIYIPYVLNIKDKIHSNNKHRELRDKPIEYKLSKTWCMRTIS